MTPTESLVPADPRAPRIVAKSIYRELVDGGFREQDMMTLASELLALVTSTVRARREGDLVGES